MIAIRKNLKKVVDDKFPRFTFSMEKPVLGANPNTTPKAKESQNIYAQKLKSNANPTKSNLQYGSRKPSDVVLPQLSQNIVECKESNQKRVSCDYQQLFGDDPNFNMEINPYESAKIRSSLIELKRESTGLDITEKELERNYFRIKNIQHRTGYLRVHFDPLYSHINNLLGE